MEQIQKQEPHPDFLKGFNEGYLLQQHLPELAQTLAEVLDNHHSERASGFKAGSREYEIEKNKDVPIAWLEPLPDDYDDISPDVDMDKDDMDIEME